MIKNQKLRLAYNLLKEAKKKVPPKTKEESMQICEKIWGAFAQATKAYKGWKTDRGYYSVIGELYQKYPQYKQHIRQAHTTARTLHSDGFYEGIACPDEEDIAIIEKSVKIIQSILKEEAP